MAHLASWGRQPRWWCLAPAGVGRPCRPTHLNEAKPVAVGCVPADFALDRQLTRHAGMGGVWISGEKHRRLRTRDHRRFHILDAHAKRARALISRLVAEGGAHRCGADQIRLRHFLVGNGAVEVVDGVQRPAWKTAGRPGSDEGGRAEA